MVFECISTSFEGGGWGVVSSFESSIFSEFLLLFFFCFSEDEDEEERWLSWDYLLTLLFWRAICSISSLWLPIFKSSCQCLLFSKPSNSPKDVRFNPRKSSILCTSSIRLIMGREFSSMLLAFSFNSSNFCYNGLTLSLCSLISLSMPSISCFSFSIWFDASFN